MGCASAPPMPPRPRRVRTAAAGAALTAAADVGRRGIRRHRGSRDAAIHRRVCRGAARCGNVAVPRQRVRRQQREQVRVAGDVGNAGGLVGQRNARRLPFERAVPRHHAHPRSRRRAPRSLDDRLGVLGVSVPASHRSPARLHIVGSRADHPARPTHRPRVAPGRAAARFGGDRRFPGSGVVLLTDDLDVAAITPGAEHLLSLVEDGRTTKIPLPIAVYTVATALLAIERATAATPTLPSTRVQTPAGGWLNVHAARLQGPTGADRIVVVVEHTERHATIPLLLSAHGLSPGRPRSPGWCSAVRRPGPSPTRCTSPGTPSRTTSRRSSTRSACAAAVISSAGFSAPPGTLGAERAGDHPGLAPSPAGRGTGPPRPPGAATRRRPVRVRGSRLLR